MRLGMLKKATLLVAAALSLGFGASQAHAGKVALGNSGWQAVIPDGADLFVEGIVGNTVILNKSATLLPDLVKPGFVEAVSISFVKANANSKITRFVIDQEEVGNFTGSTVKSFTIATQSGATFDTAASAGFGSNDKFSSSVFTSNSLLSLTGGTGIANQDVWTPTSNPGLVINSNGDFFVLTEQAGSTPPTNIPLPAAAWSGLSGLAGLGLVSASKNIRKFLA